jgi:hypothetical protein
MKAFSNKYNENAVLSAAISSAYATLLVARAMFNRHWQGFS